MPTHGKLKSNHLYEQELFCCSMVTLTWCECSISVFGHSWLMVPGSWYCLNCWEDVYRSTNPGNSLCMFTEIYSVRRVDHVETILKRTHLRSTLSCSGPLLHRCSQSRSAALGKSAIIPQASFKRMTTPFGPLSFHNAVTHFKSS